jgi:GntR family transcriptional repressor for pyruvate dehydrogenase complex
MSATSSIISRIPKRRKAYEPVAQAIREQVFSGVLKEGQRLPSEREMSEQFGVSRVVVREAIRTLELAGILRVQKGAGGGTFVSTNYDKPLSASIENLLAGGAITLDNLFELRLMLEGPAAEKAALDPRPEALAALDEIVEFSENVRDDSGALRKANLEFHRRLVAQANNPLLSVLCETVISILVSALEGQLSIKTSQAVLDYHKRIVVAIRAGKAKEARSLLEGDLAQLHLRYKEMGIQLKKKSQSGGAI